LDGKELIGIVVLAGMQERDYKFGADTSMAAGPIGAVSGSVLADIVSFAYSKGAFGGAAFDGAVLEVNPKANQTFYKKAVSAKDLLILKTVTNPTADPLRGEQ
jgi:SH3 domain-containing YSC84-like protein 1